MKLCFDQMSRISLIILIVVFSCLAPLAGAQGGRTPGPEVLQSFPNQAQYYHGAGNYDLLSQVNKGNNPTNIPENHQQLKATQLTQFPLEFAISQEKQVQLRAVELLYSMNHGQNYYPYQTIPATEKKFVFNAPENGEYWFVFRAIYKNGEVKSMGATPALRVLVDTVPPQMTLDARRNPAGEVIVEWTLEDAALKNAPPGVSLSYDSNATTMKLAVDPKNVKREGNRETGHVAFWPLHNAEVVEIICEQEDAAGNREIQTRRLVLKPSQNQSSHSGDVSEVTTPFARDRDEEATSPVQPVPDMSVLPPPPIVLQDSQRAQFTNAGYATEPAATHSADPLAGVLQALSAAAPPAVSAGVTQPYADGFADGFEHVTTQPPAPAPGMISSVPPAQFLPGNSTIRINTPTTTAASTAANAPQWTGPNAESNAADGVVVTSTTEDFPGKITGVSLGHDENQPFGGQQYLIVRWMPGETPFAESKVDCYRSETKYGPWRPIAFDLKNTGQHYWPVSVADQMPFYLRVDMRTTQGAFTDFTVQPIALPLSLSAPLSGSFQQENPTEPQP